MGLVDMVYMGYILGLFDVGSIWGVYWGHL